MDHSEDFIPWSKMFWKMAALIVSFVQPCPILVKQSATWQQWLLIPWCPACARPNWCVCNPRSWMLDLKLDNLFFVQALIALSVQFVNGSVGAQIIAADGNL